MSDDHRTKPAVGPQEGDLSIKLVAWTARTFTFDLPLGAFPAVLERLRRTPARATELISGAAENLLSMRLNGKWSVKEHLGHLADLGTLEELRLREFLSAPRSSRPPTWLTASPKPPATIKCLWLTFSSVFVVAASTGYGSWRR